MWSHVTDINLYKIIVSKIEEMLIMVLYLEHHL